MCMHIQSHTRTIESTNKILKHIHRGRREGMKGERSEKITQSVKCLPCKHGGPEFDLAETTFKKKKPGMTEHSCNPSTGKAETRQSWGLLLANLDEFPTLGS